MTPPQAIERSLIAERLAGSAREAGLAYLPYSDAERILRIAWAEGALQAHDGNKSAAARDGGINRSTLARMLG